MSFFRTLLGSFYSADTYRAVRHRPGHGLAYSFFLVALSSLVMTVYYVCTVNMALFQPAPGKSLSVFDDALQQVAAQIPVMVLKDGVLMTKEPKPTHIHLRIDAFGYAEEGLIATIDTTGQTTHANMPTPMLFTAREMVMVNDGEVKIRPYADMFGSQQAPMVINRAVAEDTAYQLSNWMHHNLLKASLLLGALLWLGYMLVLYVLRICMLLVLSLLGMIIGAIMDNKVPFDGLMRLAALSYTPVVVLGVVFTVAFGAGDVMLLWLMLCGVVMLATALWVTRETPLAVTA